MAKSRMREACFVLSVLLVIAGAGACDSPSDCFVESFCDEEERMHQCNYSEGAGRTEWITIQCGEGDLAGRPFCVETSHGVRCALSDQPVPACTGLPEEVAAQHDGFAHNCDATAEVVCYGEYLVAKEICRSCTLDDGEADGVRCDGGLYSSCDDDQACADDLTCQSDPQGVTTMCTKSCPCEDGICDECATTSGPAWCEAGMCRP